MMEQKDRHWLFVAMLVTVPCPSVLLFCNGLLPVSGLILGVVSFAAVSLRDPLALVFAIALLVYSVIYGAGLYWLAGLLSRRLASDRVRAGWRGAGILLAAVLVLAIVPTYTFDCMDGASSRWCDWYELHLGWFGVTEACGDFHW